ncbi:hypothetical protein [Marinoscillum sp. 108]|uniref:hypothetical protein n=1 Tax=Marinoscillum sp. 108 TaxID=2653151 RepID=UPI0012F020CD|nr:hypothetical protein [Marinoscillum sp. 108]VXD11431.1 conserved hypothetical protein [Marinoscillum sp. 108]
MHYPKRFPHLILLLLVIASCSPEKPATNEEKVSFEGSWNLVAYIPHSEGLTEWNTYSDDILYQKHLTSDHFTWIKYDTKNEQLLGMGGGSYSINTGQYVENIEFFFPPGSSELGQAIPFNFELTDGIWYHTGYAKEMDMDMETGEIVVIDSNKIEEKWIKTSLPPNTNTSVMGTWELTSYLDASQKEFMEYPEFIGYIKLITPTHFTWIYFDKDADEIYASGSGSYRYENGKYSETIDMIYPTNSGQIGETITFKSDIENSKWKHAGYLPNIIIDSTNGDIVRDSILIDEVWALHSDKSM